MRNRRKSCWVGWGGVGYFLLCNKFMRVGSEAGLAGRCPPGSESREREDIGWGELLLILGEGVLLYLI